MFSLVFANALLLLLPQEAQPISLQEALGQQEVARIVSQETGSYVREFTQMTKLTPVVADDFNGHIVPRVLPVLVESKTAAEITLRMRFRLFLANMTVFLLGTQQDLVFDAAHVDVYLVVAVQAKKCGEVPCVVGCPEGCDVNCNPCPSSR